MQRRGWVNHKPATVGQNETGVDTISGPYAGLGILVQGATNAFVQSCNVVRNLAGLEARGAGVVTVSRCSFSENYSCCIQATERAAVRVRDCSFMGTSRMELVRTLARSQASLDIENSTFEGTDTTRRGDDSYGVFVADGTSAAVRNCEFRDLAASIKTVGGLSLIVEHSRIRGAVIGISIRNPAYSETEAHILLNDIRECGAGIRLYGQSTLVEITQNLISADWRAIDVCLPGCGCTSPEGPPFVGTIVGTGNHIEGANGSTCPPWRSPFWPANFTS
jgi:hypothetical protein